MAATPTPNPTDNLGTRQPDSQFGEPQPTEKSNPVGSDNAEQGFGRGRPTKQSPDPPKKATVEARHRIKSANAGGSKDLNFLDAFAASLKGLNAARAKANEINERRWLRDEDLKRQRLDQDKRFQAWTESNIVKQHDVETRRYEERQRIEKKQRQWAQDNAELDRLEKHAEKEQEVKAARVHERELEKHQFIENVFLAGQNTSTDELLRIIRERYPSKNA